MIGQQGPPDGTVIVTLASGNEFEDELVNSVIEALGSCGEIILVRSVEELIAVVVCIVSVTKHIPVCDVLCYVSWVYFGIIDNIFI